MLNRSTWNGIEKKPTDKLILHTYKTILKKKEEITLLIWCSSDLTKLSNISDVYKHTNPWENQHYHDIDGEEEKLPTYYTIVYIHAPAYLIRKISRNKVNEVS